MGHLFSCLSVKVVSSKPEDFMKGQQSVNGKQRDEFKIPMLLFIEKEQHKNFR